MAPALALAVLAAAMPACVTTAATPSPDATGATASAVAAPERVELGGVAVRLRDGTRQVVTVNHHGGYAARVSYWRERDDRWERIGTTRDGRIGYGGLVPGDEREQGTGTTPLGSYAIARAFGNGARPPGSTLPYHRVRKGDYWVQDNKSAHYNRLRNKADGGFRWRLPAERYNGSERLRDYPRQYRWSIVIKYNWREPVRGRGAGIFLHVNGDGATAGCVSAPRRFIRSTLTRLRADRAPVIALGR